MTDKSAATPPITLLRVTVHRSNNSNRNTSASMAIGNGVRSPVELEEAALKYWKPEGRTEINFLEPPVDSQTV